jgi:predicted GTPase
MASDSYDHLFKVGLHAVLPCKLVQQLLPQRIITTRDMHAQVLLVGDSAVGKSCLLMRFTADRFDEVTTSTIGMAAALSVQQVGQQQQQQQCAPGQHAASCFCTV